MVAWQPLGWAAAWFAEIEPFPCAVLDYHYSEIPNHGDFTKITKKSGGTIDLLVGGTPCQSFSSAGERAGLDDARGLLAFEFLALARRLRPRWLVFENVPGLLSSGERRDFGAILGAMGKCGYRFAYRILDAQYFGVPQRRRRVFIIGYLGNWQRPAAVLLERQSLSRHSPPRKEERPRIASTLTGGSKGSGHRYGAHESVAGQLIAFDPTQITSKENRSNPKAGEPCHTLAGKAHPPFIVYQQHGSNVGPIGTLPRGNGSTSGGIPFIAFHARQNPIADTQRRVRRFTPRECERLQGFPDDYTLIPWKRKPRDKCPDAPRYRALGESMAIPVMNWIGRRIQAVEEMEEGS